MDPIIPLLTIVILVLVKMQKVKKFCGLRSVFSWRNNYFGVREGARVISPPPPILNRVKLEQFVGLFRIFFLEKCWNIFLDHVAMFIVLFVVES